MAQRSVVGCVDTHVVVDYVDGMSVTALTREQLIEECQRRRIVISPRSTIAKLRAAVSEFDERETERSLRWEETKANIGPLPPQDHVWLSDGTVVDITYERSLDEHLRNACVKAKYEMNGRPEYNICQDAAAAKHCALRNISADNDRFVTAVLSDGELHVLAKATTERDVAVSALAYAERRLRQLELAASLLFVGGDALAETLCGIRPGTLRDELTRLGWRHIGPYLTCIGDIEVWKFGGWEVRVVVDATNAGSFHTRHLVDVVAACLDPPSSSAAVLARLMEMDAGRE